MKTLTLGGLDQARDRVSFGRASSRGDLELHQQTVAVFHQRMAHVGQLGFLAWAFSTQTRIWIGGALVGRIRTLLAVEVQPTDCSGCRHQVASARAVHLWDGSS